MWTVSGGVTSRPLERQDRLYPESVSGINATRITDTEIRLVWQIPRGDYDGFEVKYIDDYEAQNARNRSVTKMVETNTINIKHLRPFRNYTFTIVTIAGAPQRIPRNSLPISAIFATKESVPGSLTEFTATHLEPRKVMFQWKLPSVEKNGIITGFVIQYGLVDPKQDFGLTEEPTFTATNSSEFGPLMREGEINNLIPGRIYTFQIQAQTKVGFGAPFQRTEKTPIWAPPLTNHNVAPKEVSHSMTTVEIMFKKDFFLNTHGEVISYAVIVAEDYTKPTIGNLTLPKWQAVQEFRPWPPYQASDLFFPFNNSTSHNFTIGTQKCQFTQGYCNGPLKPGTIYRIKIRAYTTRELFSESKWSAEIKTDPDNTVTSVPRTIF